MLFDVGRASDTKLCRLLWNRNLVEIELSQARTQGGFRWVHLNPPLKLMIFIVCMLVYTHLLALIHINYETEIDIDNVCKMFLQKHPKRMENSSLLFL